MSNLCCSNDYGHSDAHSSKDSTPISKTRGDPWTDGIPLSEFNANDTWGGFDEDSHMSSPSLDRMYSPPENLGKCALPL
jgi:hypothetical protein